MRTIKSFYDRLGMNLAIIQGNKTDQEMAYLIGEKSRNTWIDRRKNPSKLKLGELTKLAERTKTPVEVILFGSVERSY